MLEGSGYKDEGRRKGKGIGNLAAAPPVRGSGSGPSTVLLLGLVLYIYMYHAAIRMASFMGQGEPSAGAHFLLQPNS